MFAAAMLCCLGLARGFADGLAAGVAAQMQARSSQRFWPFDTGFDYMDDHEGSVAQAPEDPLVQADFADVSMPDEMARSSPVKGFLHRRASLLSPKRGAAQGFPGGLLPGAMLEFPQGSRGERSTVPEPLAPSVKRTTQPKIIKSFDMLPDDDDDVPETRPHDPLKSEELTMEDLRRRRVGDVEHTKPSKSLAPRTTTHHFAAIARKRESAAVSSKKTKLEKEIVSMPPGPAKMMQQCTSFGNYLKNQRVSGIEFVRLWQGTCNGAVLAGNASPQYAKMCSALTSAVGQYAGSHNWDVMKTCHAVLSVFAEAGVGNSPLAP